MSNTKITQAVLTVDGQVLQKNSDGTYSPLTDNSDLQRVEKMDEEELTNIAQNDPNNPEWTAFDFEQTKPAKEVFPELFEKQTTQQINYDPLMIKENIVIRLDADIIQWLKDQGPDFQQRVNSILRHEMEQK